MPPTFADSLKVQIIMTDISQFVRLKVIACEHEGITTPEAPTPCDVNLLNGLLPTSVSASSYLPLNPPKESKLNKEGWIPEPNDQQKWIQFEFEKPTVIKSVTIKAKHISHLEVQARLDEVFTTVKQFESPENSKFETISLDEPILITVVRIQIKPQNFQTPILNADFFGCTQGEHFLIQRKFSMFNLT